MCKEAKFRMQRKIIGLLCAGSLLLLPACHGEEEPAAETAFTPEEMAQAVLDSQWELPGTVEFFSGESRGLESLLKDSYDLSPEDWVQGASVQGAGTPPLEITVVELAEDVSREEAEAWMLRGLEAQTARFRGYSPDTVTYLEEHSRVWVQLPYAVLAICPDLEAGEAAFLACFDGEGPEGAAAWTETGGEETPGGAGVSEPYDLSPILSAWETGDPSGLDGDQQAIYARALELAEELFRPEMSGYEKELAAHDWMTEHVEVWELCLEPPEPEKAKDDPYGPLVLGAGDCLGFSSTFQLLMDLAGVECVTVVGSSFEEESLHSWNMVCLDGSWYHVDVSWDVDDVEEPHRFLNVSDGYMEEMAHQWDRSQYPAAETEGPNPDRSAEEGPPA